MVWPAEEKFSLAMNLITLKEKCASLHQEEFRALPDVTTSWPSYTSFEVSISSPPPVWNKQKFRALPLLELNFVNPSEAAGDTRLAVWEFPKKTRLTDTGVYLAMKYLGRGDRNRRHPYDFIQTGHIFRGRVPSGKPVILWAHGLAWIAVWRKSHILCGEKLAH